MGVGFYIFIFIIVFVINTFVPRAKNAWTRRFLLLLSLCIMLGMIGFRYKVGVDYDSYLKIYRDIEGGSLMHALKQNVDPMNSILFWTFSKIISVDYWIFFMYGIASILPLYLINRRFRYKFLNYSILTYCCLFLPFSLNGMMQGAAMSLILFAFINMADKRYRATIILLLLAFLVHKSAILVLPYFILYLIFRKKNRRFARASILCTILISIFILFFLGEFLMKYSADFYGSYGYIINRISIDRLSFATTLFYLPIVVLSFISRGKKKDEEMSAQRSIIYSGAIYNFIGSSAQYLNRIALYFMVFSVVATPYQLSVISDYKKRALLKIALATYLIAVFIVQVVVLEWYGILPYQTWLFGVI